MATIERRGDPVRAVQSDETPDETAAPVEATDDGEQPDYFFWGINELYVAP